MNRRERIIVMRRILQAFDRFARDERGTVIVETVIVAPLLFWTVMAMFSYWDVYRSVNVIQKAAYTVSDVISRQRENDGVTATDLNGFRTLLNYLIDQDQQAVMRVTSLTYDDATDQYEVLWSCSPGGGMAVLTTAVVNTGSFTTRLPIIADSDTRILAETQVDYVPVFDVGVPYYGAAIGQGVDRMTIGQFVVTRPRLAPRIDLASCA
jgi:hypothetical protein